MKLYCADCMDILFLSTLSLRRATAPKHGVCRGGINFYPRSPCGERLSAFHSAQPDLRFLSTLSLRRATIRHELAALVAEFLSTLSLRRATIQIADIQITFADFYPRSPCGERRKQPTGQEVTKIFLSTLSLRRATAAQKAADAYALISIHALLAESDNLKLGYGGTQAISIHALLAESDSAAGALARSITTFLSTLSLRRATPHRQTAEPSAAFLSTLSLRRATPDRRFHHHQPVYFYPRSPCGERHNGYDGLSQVTVFLSTLSLRRATDIKAALDALTKISIHALLAESDYLTQAQYDNAKSISIHALLAESDHAVHFFSFFVGISIHALLAESDASTCACRWRMTSFLSTLSLRRATSGTGVHLYYLMISIHALLAESDTCINQHFTNLVNFYPRSPCGERLYYEDTV